MRACVLQFRKALDTTSPAWQLQLSAVMLYCREGVYAPPRVINKLLQLRELRARMRAAGLNALASACQIVSTSTLPDPSLHFRTLRELLLPIQPALAPLTTTEAISRWSLNGADPSPSSVTKQRHYLLGLAGASFAAIHAARMAFIPIAMAAVNVLRAPNVDLWSFQVWLYLCF